MLDSLTGSLEENVLTLLCFDAQNAPALATRITPELFSTLAYRQLAKVAINHLERYHTPPAAHLRDLFEDKLRRGTDDAKLLRQTLDAMDALAPGIQPQYVLAELDTFIETSALSRALETAMEDLSRGKLKEAREALHTVRTHPGKRKGIWLHKPEESLAFLEQTAEDLVSSGIDALDIRRCCPNRRGLFGMFAPPNYGKTWGLVNCGKANIIRGYNVLHVSLEMNEHQIAQRYIQQIFALSKDDIGSVRTPSFSRDDEGRCTGMDFNQYDVRQLTEDMRPELITRMSSLKSRGKLRIEHFPSGSLTVPQLAAFMEYLARQEDFVPDVVLVDYWDLMKIDASDVRVSTGRIGVELRGLADVTNSAFVTASQIGRAGTKAKMARGTDVTEDYSKMMTTDTVVIFNQTEAEEKANLARIWVEKSRDAPKHYMVLISQSYATGQFAIDSVFMDARVKEHAKQMVGDSDD